MKLHQSGNKIIVTDLNPMSDLHVDDFVLLKIKHCAELTWGRIVLDSDKDKFDGWLPVPVYDPSHKQPDDFSRGVRVMFDYLQTRIANNFSGNKEVNAQLEQINNTLNEWLSDALEEVSPDDYQEWLSLHQAYAAGIEKCRKGHDLLDRLRPSPGSGHERYEKLKNLSLQQFKEVYVHLLCGKSLNQIVDEL